MADNTSKWWPLSRLIPHKTHIKFVSFAIPAGILSIILVALSTTVLVLSMMAFPKTQDRKSVV